jgi:hypothetical protein
VLKLYIKYTFYSLATFFFPLALIADAPATHSTCKQVHVQARTILASKPISGDVVSTSIAKQVDSRLSDIESKLNKLPFAEYRLLVDRSFVVPLMKRRSVTLSDGQLLTVRPIYANEERVGVWLKWQDQDGAEIIDSRLHFDCNQPFLTGMERNDDKGLILAVTVKPDNS